MATLRPLRGECQCRRNRYIITIPRDDVHQAQVLFNTEPVHQIPFGTPLAAYIRVPLSWYHSTTHAFFADETHATIRRVYTHPTQQHSKRHFCGYCGTSFSYWSEKPWTEAEFISLTLGSLLREDLRDLEDMGLIPNETQNERAQTPTSPLAVSVRPRLSNGVPWFEGMVAGSRLASLSRTTNRDGRTEFDWEIVDFTDGEDAAHDVDISMTTPVTTPGKRKLQDREDAEPGPNQ
ncbi:hypothetical protein B0I35DRAFT_19338 [Stachybotrys elegans]|uniref:CENP-V/GFA domain-containing protein n=1 Tax=Stachybotrys elegans TaxID=80388 RepID=A0A8K0WWB0_9HYPO|nr:hypothetical protein B0I35DRAFT_19338 [Stachybotrys elegans]